MIQGTSSGSIEMGHNDFSALGQLYEQMSVFNLPYIYEDRDHLMRATDPRSSEVLQELNKELVDKSDIRVIGGWYYGRRQLTCNSAIKKPADLNNKKIRAIPLKVFLTTVRGLGAQPEAVDFSELPSALATGVVDGQENPLVTIDANKFYEQQSHLMMTSHITLQLPVYINEKAWQGLSEENQQTVRSTIAELRAESLAEGKQKEQELRGTLQEKGMTIIDESSGLQLDAFKESVNDEVESAFSGWSDLVSRIEKI
ncbi:hypothetical protein AUR66_19725 [Haloferax profundi]|uniref:TRAP dicarboxylate transporter subunit DctP n=2 Tax=Haloferax profundi TaxID=1544718 RepID=A0A0W1RFR1_9EURY|nr:hypothetical protein AUR66_19725 [Haloferax profundi]